MCVIVGRGPCLPRPLPLPHQNPPLPLQMDCHPCSAQSLRGCPSVLSSGPLEGLWPQTPIWAIPVPHGFLDCSFSLLEPQCSCLSPKLPLIPGCSGFWGPGPTPPPNQQAVTHTQVPRLEPPGPCTTLRCSCFDSVVQLLGIYPR